MEKQEIAQLVLEAQSCSSTAISALFVNYKNEVYSIAMRETKDRVLSDDIVQETFVEVILKINDLENPAAFPSWLKIVAYHQCTRYYKKKETIHETAAIENEDGISIFDTAEERNASFIPDEALDQREFKATILEMIDNLPDAQRAALHMFYFEEMSLKDIAAAQGVSVNTANTRLNRGRLAMKDSIEKYEKKHGIRLHTIAFFPFFKWLLKGSEEAMSAKSTAQVVQKISAETGVTLTIAKTGTAVATTGTTVAVGTKSVAASVLTKIVAGVAAASIAVSAPFVALQINNEDSDSISEEYSAVNETNNIQNVEKNELKVAEMEDIPLSQNPSMEYYAPVFDQYRNLLNHSFSIDPEWGVQLEADFSLDLISWLLIHHSFREQNNIYVRDINAHYYYAFEDLNDDGIEELFIGLGSSGDDINIYSLFSFDGGKPVRLVEESSLGERSRMTIYEDNTFSVFGSGGAFYSGQWHYRLLQDSLNPEAIEEYQHDNGKYYWKDNTGNYIDITQEEYISAVNNEGKCVKQLDWQEIIPAQPNNNSQILDIQLQDYLDFSKAWSTDWYINGEHIVITYAFDVAGQCYCTSGWWRSDLFGCYTGSYSIEGNVVHFYMNMEDNIVSYSYKYSPEKNQFVQVSENGLYSAHSQGDVFSLSVHDDYSAADIKRMAQNGLVEFP